MPLNIVFLRPQNSEKSQRVKTQRVKTSENFVEEKNIRRRYFRRFLRRYHFYRIFIVFLDIFEIFAEDYFLLRSFRMFLPSGFLPLSRFQKLVSTKTLLLKHYYRRQGFWRDTHFPAPFGWL